MQGSNSKRSRAASARGFVALWAVLALVLACSARPAAAAPFVYVTNFSGAVSVIDIATNNVVATVQVGRAPFAVAVTPDGQHAYVVNKGSNTVSVIDTATNTVAATVGVGSVPFGVAFTLDGRHAYVANLGSNNVSVIRTASRTVVATVAAGTNPYWVGSRP